MNYNNKFDKISKFALLRPSGRIIHKSATFEILIFKKIFCVFMALYIY